MQKSSDSSFYQSHYCNLVVKTDSRFAVRLYLQKEEFEIKVMIYSGGYIKSGLFRIAMSQSAYDDPLKNGPIDVTPLRTADGRGLRVDVYASESRSDDPHSTYILSAETCEEIHELIDLCQYLSHAYK